VIVKRKVSITEQLTDKSFSSIDVIGLNGFDAYALSQQQHADRKIHGR
jgi:hypothetical protein